MKRTPDLRDAEWRSVLSVLAGMLLKDAGCVEAASLILIESPFMTEIVWC